MTDFIKRVSSAHDCIAEYKILRKLTQSVLEALKSKEHKKITLKPL